MEQSVVPDIDPDEMPMSGLRVLDLSQAYLGPYATFLMAKAGADVIKIETKAGDMTRLRSAVAKGATLPFSMLNTNKRSITLNLKCDEGRQVLLDLAKDADVLVENFSPGVLDRLGVGWDTLRTLNPRLIYASGSGFGLTGSHRDRQAMDICVQAVSGAMSITGAPNGPPLKAGPAFADFHAGIHLYAGTVTALLQRARTGKGRLVEVAMQEAIYPSLSSSLGMLHETGEAPQGTGNRHGGLALCPYSVYRASDGWVAIACVVDEHWVKLTGVMNAPQLATDPRYATTAQRCARMQEVDDLVTDWTGRRTRMDIVNSLAEARIAVGEVRDLKEVMFDANMHARGMLEWLEDPVLGRIVVPSTPLRLHDVPLPPTTRRPELGEHTDDILRDVLGLTQADIQRLRDVNAV